MHDLMNWGDDDQPPLPRILNAPVVLSMVAIEPSAPNVDEQLVTFRDVADGTTRTGRVIRTITSTVHTNPHLGHLPAVTLFLVAYESATRKDDLAVIDPSLIVHPKKPRS